MKDLQAYAYAHPMTRADALTPGHCRAYTEERAGMHGMSVVIALSVNK